jgi:hypothetical protein
MPIYVRQVRWQIQVKKNGSKWIPFNGAGGEG